MGGNGKIHVSAEKANAIDLPCKRGHVGYWTPRIRPERDGAISRDCSQCGRDKVTAQNYGMTRDELTAFREAHPVCGICGDNTAPLEIDHDHTTEKVRGHLCRRCNIFLGYYESRKHLIPAMEAYLCLGS